MIKESLKNTTLGSVMEENLAKLNSEEFEFSVNLKTNSTGKNPRNPFLEPKRKMLEMFENFKNFLGDDFEKISRLKICEIPKELTKKIRGKQKDG